MDKELSKALNEFPTVEEMHGAALKWEQWIYNIVRDIEAQHCPQGIIDHIEKHFVADLQKHLQEESETGATNWDIWFSSANNLLAIFYCMRVRNNIKGFPMYPVSNHFIKQMLERLQYKYDRNPETHTPPPTNY